MASESPVAVIYGYNGTSYIETSTRSGIAVPSGQPGFLFLGSDGTNTRYARMASDGTIRIDPTGTTAQPVTGTFWQATQPVSIAATVAVSGPLTDTQLRATPVPVSGTVTANAGTGTFAISAVSLPLPTGAATAALQTQPGVDIGDVTVNNGAGAAAVNVQDGGNSLTVDGTVAVSNFPATQPISAASLPLPTGASTSALQTTGNTSLGNIDTKTPALGQAAMAASTPVVIASNQTAVPVSMAANGYGGQVEGRAADGATPVGNPVLIGGSDGTNTQTVLTDALGRIVTAPSGAGATVAGFALGTMVTTATTDVPVRATAYTEPAANAQRSISSANANDAAAGTGARQVKITYLDSTGAGPFTETVTLNGTTAVATVATNICFIERLEVVSVGSTGSNVGIITLFANAAGGGGTVGTIAATANRTFWAHHYTPTGKTSYITSVAGNNTNTSNVTVLSIRAKANGANLPEVVVSDYVAVGGAPVQESRNFGTAIQVPGPARITLYGAPAGTPSITTRASFDYYDQ